MPHLENIATLIDPPGSLWTEGGFIKRVVRSAPAPLLLDLHNLYANAWNFGADPLGLLLELPLECVACVHLSGGHFAPCTPERQRLVDDHLHDPPDVVFELLEEVAARVPQDLTVILERDGGFPDFAVLLAQIERARLALAAGRSRRPAGTWPHAA